SVRTRNLEHRKSECGATRQWSQPCFGSRQCREANQLITNYGLATRMSALQPGGVTCLAKLPCHCLNPNRSRPIECVRVARGSSQPRDRQLSMPRIWVRAQQKLLVEKIFKKKLAHVK